MSRRDRIPALDEIRRDVLHLLTREAELEHGLDELMVLAVRPEVVVSILVIALLLFAPRPFADECLVRVGADDVLPVGVRKLLRHDKRDAEQHLARRVVAEREMVGETEVADVPVIEHIDELSAFLHIACQPVWSPGDDAVIFSRLEVIEHGTKQRAFV